VSPAHLPLFCFFPVTDSSAILLTTVQRNCSHRQEDRNHWNFQPLKVHHRNPSSIRDQIRALTQSLMLSLSTVKEIAANREALRFRVHCLLSSLSPFLPSPLNFQLNNPNSLNCCLYFFFSTSLIVFTAFPGLTAVCPELSLRDIHRTSQSFSALPSPSRAQRLHHAPCRLNSYLYIQVQHLPLSQQHTIMFSL